MARRNPASFMKRMKELKRKEKARLKRERRFNKRNRNAAGEGRDLNQSPFPPPVTEGRPGDGADIAAPHEDTQSPIEGKIEPASE